MKIILSILFAVLLGTIVKAQNETFTETVLATGLNNPWEITYGPDNKLWVTESKGYKVKRIDPVTGVKEELLDLSLLIPSGNPQGGMMGLAIHPEFLTGKPYFYLAYVYAFNYSLPNNEGSFFSTRISRFTCNVNLLANPLTVTLQSSSEVIIKNELPGSNDHNSGRLAINLSDNKLYYTIGDMGAGQFNNTNRPNNAQDTNILEGKVLRFNLEPDAMQTGDAAWIPDDNPFVSAGNPTPVYSYGHRNAQGLVWASFNNGIGKLYSSEHHDKTDDEINEIQAGKNYMWPKVSGFCDGNYNGLALANKPVNETDDLLTTPIKFCDGAANKKEPLAILFYASKAEVQALSPNSGDWPTIAPSSIDFYKHTSAIPGWYPSLLIPSLKTGAIYRIKINTNGTIPVNATGEPDTISYFRFGPSNNQSGLNRRWRDVCISPDGTTIFACTDNTDGLSNPGSIIKFAYRGVILSLLNTATSGIHFLNKYVSIYPNPVFDNMIVTHTLVDGSHYSYFITNYLNRTILTGSYTGKTARINVSRLTPGMYILKIYDKNNVCVALKKVLKR
jgi:aldose sugar dehydrogenase